MRLRTVLVAEADSKYALWLLSCLAEAHVTVLASVNSPGTALAVGVEHTPDLALIGVKSLNCAMFAAGTSLARRSPGTRVLFYTPNLTVPLVTELTTAGAAAIASRSWTRSMVAQVVSSLLLTTPDLPEGAGRRHSGPNLPQLPESALTFAAKASA
jgi:DNA-binding NarL/FixJ family response regulator